MREPIEGGPEELAHQRRVLRTFEELVELDEAEREERLGSLAESHARLADDVRVLLAADAEPTPLAHHDFPPVDQLVPAPGTGTGAGERVGAYELLRPVGSGGMGQVFEALQDRPRRRVALKMLRIGLDSANARRRFEVEAEILARLRHPGIAQVYEAGVHREGSVSGTREVPWFALEFVEDARTLIGYAEEERLSLRARLELFAQVCDAVHHGHQRGVIHRDLKPANVLVGRDGSPKVIDFGVARATGQDGEGKTRTSEVLGTLSAMSPEQLVGDPADVDLRCDVYALGVMLYELLAGRPPHDLTGLGLHDVTRRIVEQRPAPLRSVAPHVPRDLERLVHTAMERDREERYPGAHDLAQDLRRFLRHEPLRARPTPALRRVALFTLRHRGGVGLSLVVASVLLVGGAVARHLARERAAAEREAERLGDALVDFSREVTFGFLDELEFVGDNTRSRAELARAAIERLEAIEARASGESRTLAALADAYMRLGELQGHPYRKNLGDREHAQRSLRRADELFVQLLARDPDSLELRVGRARTSIALGALASEGAGLEAAREMAGRALDQVAELMERAPDDPDVLLLQAYSLFLMGASQHMNPEAMGEAFAQAEGVYRELLVEHPEQHGILSDLAHLLNTRGEAGIVFRRFEEAMGDIEEAGELLGRALELSPGNANHLRALMVNAGSMAHLLEAMGEPGDLVLGAVEVAREELEGLRELDPFDAFLLRRDLVLTLLEARTRLGMGERGSDGEGALRTCLDRGLELVEALEERGVPTRDGILGLSLARLEARAAGGR